MTHEYGTLTLDSQRLSVKAAATAAPPDAIGRFSGYLAVFGSMDGNGDVIDRGAFRKTLAEAEARRQRTGSKYLLPLLYQHDTHDPIGGVVSAREDDHGLYVEGELDLDVPHGAATYSGMKMGYTKGLSIGYTAPGSTWDAQRRRHLTDINLLEGSSVVFPAHPEAVVMSVKSRLGRALTRTPPPKEPTEREQEERRQERRDEAQADRIADAVRAGLRTATVTPAQAPAPPTQEVSSLAQVADALVATGTALVGQLTSELAADGYGHEVGTAEDSLTRTITGVVTAVRQHHPTPPFTQEECASLLAALRHHLSAEAAAEQEAARVRTLNATGRARAVITRWQQRMRAQQAASTDTQALIHGDDTEARAVLRTMLKPPPGGWDVEEPSEYTTRTLETADGKKLFVVDVPGLTGPADEDPG